MSREDRYHEALEAFIRTSAGYLDVDVPASGRNTDDMSHSALPVPGHCRELDFDFAAGEQHT
jgi:hypothetical protein